MEASGKVGIVQTAIQAVSAVGTEFVFFKAIAAAAAAMILRIPLCAFNAYAVLTAIPLAFVKTALCAKTAIVAHLIFLKAISAGAGRCRLAAGKALAAVLAHLVRHKALIARFAEMLAPAR